MSLYCASTLHTQNNLLLKNLQEFYKTPEHMEKLTHIINGESKISLRILDWFVTNFAKKYYTIYELPIKPNSTELCRFKVYNDYKLKLKAYSKKNFDPFCRWERLTLPGVETTIGQLNFFKWAIGNRIIDYIEEHYTAIENDMNRRNSTTKRNNTGADDTIVEEDGGSGGKTRKKREELSISACKCIKKELVKIVVKF